MCETFTYTWSVKRGGPAGTAITGTATGTPVGSQYMFPTTDNAPAGTYWWAQVSVSDASLTSNIVQMTDLVINNQPPVWIGGGDYPVGAQRTFTAPATTIRRGAAAAFTLSGAAYDMALDPMNSASAQYTWTLYRGSTSTGISLTNNGATTPTVLLTPNAAGTDWNCHVSVRDKDGGVSA